MPLVQDLLVGFRLCPSAVIVRACTNPPIDYGWVITSYTKKLAQKFEKVSSSVKFNEICYLFFSGFIV